MNLWKEKGRLEGASGVAAPLPKADPALLKLKVQDIPFALLDTETTGISPASGARVCELAVLIVQDGRELGSFHSLINPQCPIHPEAQRIHGISDAMVASSPTFELLAGKLENLLAKTALVCHNAPFDVGFLNAEFKRAGRVLPGIPVVDTLSLARRHFKFQRNSLGHIATALGIAPEGWHRASADVRILRGIFERFLQDLSRKGARTLGDLVKLSS